MSYNATLRVWRGDEAGGALQDFTVEVNEGEVVLDIIHRLQQTQTPDLAVRWNCKAGKCGSCSAEINGKQRLMCVTRMSTLAADEVVTVTPLRTFPGVRDLLLGQDCHFFNARDYPARGEAGALLGRAGKGVVRATVDGAVWIGHGRLAGGIKLPLAGLFPEVAALPEQAVAEQDIRYEEEGEVGFLHFDFYNGAMGTAACERLLAAYEAARMRPTRVIVLLGGEDFFSNGLDLNRIEAAASPPDESWRNINAMDDLCRAIISTDSHLTIAAPRGNAGAGGAFLALAADVVWARHGVILNPHYKNMGNLYGSEYWSYLLPRRVGAERAGEIMRNRLPLGADLAARIGFIDACFGDGQTAFLEEVRRRAAALADEAFAARLDAKRARRAADEAEKPLESYREAELRQMRRNFYGFDPSYHVARHHFVARTPHSWTPRHLAVHREPGWVAPLD